MIFKSQLLKLLDFIVVAPSDDNLLGPNSKSIGDSDEHNLSQVSTYAFNKYLLSTTEDNTPFITPYIYV